MTAATIGGTPASFDRGWRWAVLAPAVSVMLLAWAARDRCKGADRAAAEEPKSRPNAAAETAKETAATRIDLQPKANQKLKESFRGVFEGNNLAELKQGIQTLNGLKFDIGEGLIRLASVRLKDDLPERVEGIKVGAKFATLHILHATAYSAADEMVIAKYVVHYDDQSTDTIEVVYGKDVRDWWCHDGDADPTRGKVAWTGSNQAAASAGSSLWLFSLTWKNPKADKKVLAIDFISTLTEAAPFLVAMTHTE
jgi:hypothetical protein